MMRVSADPEERAKQYYYTAQRRFPSIYGVDYIPWDKANPEERQHWRDVASGRAPQPDWSLNT